MFEYIIQRILLIFPTLFLITVVSFGISRLAPGDPAKLKAGISIGGEISTGQGEDLNKEILELIRKQWNLDKPIFYFSILNELEPDNPKSFWERLDFNLNGTKNQYHIWTANILKFDFGKSFRDNEPVIDKLKRRIPVTMVINLISLLIAYCIAIHLGIYSAVNQNSLFERFSTFIVFMLYSLPRF